jgi:hypothetical protein
VSNNAQTDAVYRRSMGPLGYGLHREAPVRVMSTERFAHVKNLQLLRERLKHTTEDSDSVRIVNMIEAEESKHRGAPDDTQ